MNSNLSQRRTGVILAAAIGALSTLTLVPPAAAQYPVGQDGHANDANNRVGGNGYNAGRATSGIINSNNIVDRTVTGGRGFSGPLGERDPRAFTGPAPSGVDNFNRQSNGVSPNNMPLYNNSAVPYYGDNRNVAPPAGSIALGFNGGYIGTTSNTPASLASGFNTTPNDQGLQIRTLDTETLLMNQALRSPDYVSALNSNFNQTGTLALSPIYGMQTNSNGTGNFNQLGTPDLNGDQSNTLRMRDELFQSANPNQKNTPNSQQNPQNNGQNPLQPESLNQPLNQPLAQPFDAPVNGALSNQVGGTSLSGNQLSQTGTLPTTDRNAMTLPPAADQSALLMTLQQRLAASGGVGKTLVDSQRASAPAKVPSAAGVTPPNPDQAPVPVSTLATGIKAEGLHNLLTSAEDMIRQGKYDSAIQQYNQAFRVVPNNPLPILGRAHAELAGGYYGKAEMDLRLIFRSDPELLLAQFDLKGLFPKDRLEFVRKDLQSLAQSDPKSERPWFLLGYLDYNTGDAISADKDLTKAEQLSGRGDGTIRLLRQHWALPSNPKPAPLTPARPAVAPAANPVKTPALPPTTAPAPSPVLNK